VEDEAGEFGGGTGRGWQAQGWLRFVLCCCGFVLVLRWQAVQNFRCDDAYLMGSKRFAPLGKHSSELSSN
jgi:hypothetical protein